MNKYIEIKQSDQIKLYKNNSKIISDYGVLYINYLKKIYLGYSSTDIVNVFKVDKFEFIRPNENIQNNMKEFNINNSYILNYKFPLTIANYLWEMNNKHNILNKTVQNICIISNTIPIINFLQILIEQNLPFNNFNIDTNIIFDKNPSIIKNKINEVLTSKNIHKNILFTNNLYDKLTDFKIKNNIDLSIIYINYLNISSMYMNNYASQINAQILLYILNNIIDNLNENSSIIVVFSLGLLFDVYLKVLTLYSYLFEEYIIDTSEINLTNGELMFLILKNKKKVNKYIIEDIKNISKSINIPNYDVELFDTYRYYSKIVEINKKLFRDDNLQFFKKIKFVDNELKLFYKKFKKDIYNFCKKWFFNASEHLNQKIKILETNTFEQYLESDIKRRNLYSCIQWEKKYNIPIKPEFDLYTYDTSYKNIILKEIVSYNSSLRFKLKHNNIDKNIDFNFKTNFNDLPDYYIIAIKKEKLESRAFDYRESKVYKQILERFKYYDHKLHKIISKKYLLKEEFITEVFIKMTEILHKFDLIKKNQKSLKSFHMCELSGSFIYAIKMFIFNKTKLNIDNWSWNVHDLKLNENNNSEKLLLEEYPDQIVFEDITNWKNIEYYINKYPKNDLISSNCEFLNYKLTYSMYLLTLGLLNKNGNCVIKRTFPITNNQELTMLYIYYLHFKEIHFYKPKMNNQSNEYYLIGMNYTPISDKLYNKLLNFLKEYELNGLLDINNFDHQFLLKIDEIQNGLLDHLNMYIRKQVYFVDTFHKLTNDALDIINETLENRTDEWLLKRI